MRSCLGKKVRDDQVSRARNHARNMLRLVFSATHAATADAWSSPQLRLNVLCPSEFLDSADKTGVQPDCSTYIRLLQACWKRGSLAEGRRVHTHIVRSGIQSSALLEDHIVEMYAKCGSIEDARSVFEKIANCDVVSWTRMISSCSQLGQHKEALSFFHKMQLQGVFPDKVALIAALGACNGPSCLAQGVGLHERIVQTGLQTDVVVSNALVNMYGKCGDVKNAYEIFEKVPRQDPISWNGIITVHAQKGRYREALELFWKMQLEGVMPNRVTFVTVVNAVSEAGGSLLSEGKQMHAEIVESGYSGEITVGNALVDMYNKCGSLENARHAFDQIGERNVVSWTAMMSAFVEGGYCDQALLWSKKMLQEGVIPNRISFVTMIDACATVNAFSMSSPSAVVGNLAEAKVIHGLAFESGLEMDFAVATALVYIYGKCGCLEVARRLFDKVEKPDLVLCTAMIAAYAEHGNYEEAFELFEQVVEDRGLKPDKVVFLSLLNGCASPQALAYGKLAHAQILKHGFEAETSVGNAIIHMYGKCGNILDARKMFDKMGERDTVSWTSMIAVYAEHGYDKEALEIFKQMQGESVVPDKVTLINVLDACSNVAGLSHGRLIHKEIVESGMEMDLVLGNAVARMYGNCGSLIEARQVFEAMVTRDVVSWNCLVTSYAQHGYVEESFQLFQKMLEECVKPDEVTFVGVLSACSHGGLVADGWQLFNSMVQDYGIAAEEIHYGCMVDLLARAGRLAEAEELMGKLPFSANEIMWTALLNGCRVHTDLERGKRATKKLMALAPGDFSHSVALSSICAASGDWEEAKKIRNEAISLVGGQSCIEVSSQIHEFVAGDHIHAQAEAIYAEVKRLENLMKEETMEDLRDNDELQREKGSLDYHSEKLAISFGLLNTPTGSAIRIKTNVRMCSDCHDTAKFISKVTDRLIMVKDARNFHHFGGGKCSCKEYW